MVIVLSRRRRCALSRAACSGSSSMPRSPAGSCMPPEDSSSSGGKANDEEALDGFDSCTSESYLFRKPNLGPHGRDLPSRCESGSPRPVSEDDVLIPFVVTTLDRRARQHFADRIPGLRRTSMASFGSRVKVPLEHPPEPWLGLATAITGETG